MKQLEEFKKEFYSKIITVFDLCELFRREGISYALERKEKISFNNNPCNYYEIRISCMYEWTVVDIKFHTEVDKFSINDSTLLLINNILGMVKRPGFKKHSPIIDSYNWVKDSKPCCPNKD